MKKDNAAYCTQAKVSEIVKSGHVFQDPLLQSIALTDGGARDIRKVLCGMMWPDDTKEPIRIGYWNEEDVTLNSLVSPSGDHTIELPRDARKVAAVIGHYIQDRISRPCLSEPEVCSNCDENPTMPSYLLPGCRQFAEPTRTKRHQACTNCILQERRCSLAILGTLPLLKSTMINSLLTAFL